MSGTADTIEGKDTIQSYWDTLENWTHVNLVRFRKIKFKMLQLGQGYLRLEEELLESSRAKKDLGILVDEKHKPEVCACSPKDSCITAMSAQDVVIVVFYSAL